MNFARVLIVIRKELTDALRDRRALYGVLIGTLFGPLFIAFMLNRIANQQRGSQEIEVPVAGREHAPILVNWLEQQAGVEITPGPANAEAAVRERKFDYVLVIPEDFAEKFRQSRPAPVQLVSDSTRQSSGAKIRRLRNLLNRFSAETGGLRLAVRGVSPTVASVLTVEDIEVSSAQQRAAMILNMIPMFIVLAAFAGGMQIATDSTAGERERGSLEPLLVNPIPRMELIAGKWLAAVVTSASAIAGTLAITTTVLLNLPLEDLGFRFRFEIPDALLLLGSILPMALIAPSVQMYLASFARSFKEAQTYMGYLIFLPMIPGIVSTFYPIGDRPWLAPVPILGQYALAVDVMGGKPASPMFLVAGAVSAVVFSLIFVALTTRLFSKERIIFGR